MSDYFDEMGWQPVDGDQIQRHQTLLVARFLMENGIFGDDFDAQSLAPPASKRLVSELPERHCTAADERCAICLKPNAAAAATDDSATDADGADDDAAASPVFKVLPCSHAFHGGCILPWLEKVGLSHLRLLFTFSFTIRIPYFTTDELVPDVPPRDGHR